MGKLTWNTLPDQDKERLVRLYELKVPLDDDANQYGFNVDTLEREIRHLIYYRDYFDKKRAAQVSFPESKSKVYVDYEVVEAEDCIIGSDIEIPDQHAEMLKLMMLVAIKNKIKTAVLAGDLVATDQASLTRWARTVQPDAQQPFEHDIWAARRVVYEMGKYVDHIIAIEGNHDARIAKATGGEIHLGMLLEGLNISYSRYPHMYIKNHRGYTKVIHPASFSGDPVVLAQQYYSVERGPDFDPSKPQETMQKCHIVLAHCHRQQRGMSPDGAYEMHTLGTLRDEARTQYKSMSATKHKQWDSGFLMIKNGYFYPFNMATTDWKAELGDMCPDYLQV